MAYTQKSLVAELKKMGSADSLPKIPQVAERIGEQELSGQLIRDIYEAEPLAWPELVLSANQAGVKKGRTRVDEGGYGLRYERIAARTGLKLSEVKELAEKAGVGDDYYIGSGRKPGNGNGSAPTKKATSGRRGRPAKAATEEPKGTSGRRGAGRKTAAAKAEPKARGRRGTRAAANPK